MPSAYQRKLKKLGYPQCRYCGLYLPKRLHERGVCDFCHEAQIDTHAFYAGTEGMDAVAYEKHGAPEPEYLPRLDRDTIAVEQERAGNAGNYGFVPGWTRKRGR